MSHSVAAVILREGKEKPVSNHHPWVFSGAVARIDGHPADGDIVEVQDARRQFMAYGYLNRHSQITVRLLSWDRDVFPDDSFWRDGIDLAVAGRKELAGENAAYRLINAESDSLPGLIVDRYAGYLVLQALTLGIERRKADIVSALRDALSPEGIYERSDVDVRAKEHLPSCVGSLWGKEPPALVEITEHGLRYLVDVRRGHKTGFYLDQRDNRQRLNRYAVGRRVLNAFAYTGSFAVGARRSGAESIVNIDSSADALALARANMDLNGYADAADEYVVGDVFTQLRAYRTAGRQFDLVILDPPKFAYSRQQVLDACRGYKDINLLAMQLLSPGGILFTMSCSGLVSPDLFQKVVFGSSIDAGRDGQILEKLSQSADHPVMLTFPEGEYLKGLVCRMR